MWANVLGIPLFVVIFLATDHYLHELDFIGDRLAINALGVCLGLIGYYAAKGIDTLINEKRDNPEPFLCDKTVPEVFGQIKEVLAESSYGPFYWNFKTVDPETSRMVATFNMTEQLGTPLTPMHVPRLIMLQILIDPIPEEEQKPLVAALPDLGKGLSTVKLIWLIDSPMNRGTVNKIQDGATKSIKIALGLMPADENKKPNPFAPPEWVLVLLLIAVCFACQRMDQYTEFKAKREQQRQEIQAERDRQQSEQEAARQKALENQAAQDAYNRQQRERFEQGRIEQQRKAQELLEQQRQNQYQPLFTPPLQNNTFAPPLGGSSGSLIQSPFHLPSTQLETRPAKPWRAGQ